MLPWVVAIAGHYRGARARSLYRERFVTCGTVRCLIHAP